MNRVCRGRHLTAVALAALAVLAAAPLAAQQPQPAPPRDTTHAREDSLLTLPRRVVIFPDTPPGRPHDDSLTRRPLTMQAVTITTTQPMRDDPTSTVRVAPEVIARAPASNPWDLVRQTAGIEVHDQGQGPGFASDASIRGFSSDHSTDVALWVDGVPINEPANGHAEGYGDWNVLFPEAVSGIDVLKGPTSALYGNFALAGVVNVRTLERMDGRELIASGGANGRIEGALLAGFDHPGTGGVFGLRGIHEDGWRPHSGYSIGQGHGRWVHDFGASTVDLGLELYASDWDSPGFLSDSLFQAGRTDVVADRTDGGFKRRAQERVSFRTITDSHMLWRTTVYATQGRWQLFLTIPPEGGGGEGSGHQTEEEDRRHGFGLTTAVTHEEARLSLTAGGEARFDASSYGNWFTTARVRDSAQAVVDARQASGALFFEGTFDAGHHVRLMAGGRADVVDTRSTPAGGAATGRSHSVFSPKLGVLVHLPGLGALYANAARGFRQTDGVVFDPSLGFITAWSYEAGLKVDRGGLSADIAAFRMDVSNEQTFNPITLTSSSGGASRRTGVEIGGTLRGGPFAFDADATMLDAHYTRLVTAAGDTLDGARVQNTARWVGSAGVTFQPPLAPWHLRLGTSFVGPYTPFDLVGTELPAYALLHASAGTFIGSRIALEIGVRNLLNTRYPELRAGDFVSPGQPRSLIATLRTAM